MATTFPGTTVEVSSLEKRCSRQLFDGVFAAGGITLSQVSIMTGLEPYLIQNWVKRGFVSSPSKRMYSRQQFARIVIINMLRETLQIEKICNLIHIIGRGTADRSDDLISDEELYHRYVDLLSDHKLHTTEPQSVQSAAESAANDFEEHSPNARSQLVRLLQVMFYAHASAGLRRSAEEILATLE
ncbi:MAG: DUF1836 domain-containing protein [Clostridia bacterium]|nr:DUF1836 domain-containing protein [Clostridia bacterium]